jgi:CBS domain-containing protein
VAIGPDDLIQALAAQPAEPGLTIGEPRSAEGFADAADAPLGPDELRQIFELVSVAASAGTAVVTLLQKIKDLLTRRKAPEGGPPPAVTLQDARTGKPLLTVDAATDVAEAARLLTDLLP